MGAAMKTVHATEACGKLYTLIDEVSLSPEPVQIKGKRGSAVLIGEEDWRSLQETLYLVSIPGMRESIIKRMNAPVGHFSKRLDW